MVQRKGNNEPPLSFDQLVVGHEFPATSCELDALRISKYLEAVGMGGEQYVPHSNLVPPLAIAAQVMTALTKLFVLPPGSIHAAQEFEFFKLVPIGMKVTCQGKVAQKVERGKLRLLMIELGALNQNGDRVLSGKATLVLPG